MNMGRGEKWVRCMEKITWKLTLPYAKQIANRNLLWLRTQKKKKQRYHFADKGPYSQSYGFFSSHVWM